MGLFSLDVGDDHMCDNHREQYAIASIVYKQFLINKAGILFLLQTLSTIIAVIIQVFGTAESRQIWYHYGLFWAALWYFFAIFGWAKYFWWFRRSNWICNHNHVGIDNNTNPEFNTIKFSIN